MSDTATPGFGPHGAKMLPSVEVDSCNLEIKDDEGFLGDRASRKAFHAILENWRKPLRKLATDPFGDTPSDDLSRTKLDEIIKEGGPGGDRRDPERDRGVRAGALARGAALPQGEGLGRHRAHRDGRRISREPHRRACDCARESHSQGRGHQGGHDADPSRSRRSGAARRCSLAPAWIFKGHDSILAVDIGGTNIRAGVVLPNVAKASDLTKASVWKSEKWRHADEEKLNREQAVDELIGMLKDLMKRAKKEGYDLAPFIGIACPGKIEEDGTIAKGAQNLPGNWESTRFNLPARLAEAIPTIDGHDTMILMHNDAVVQGLSETPFMQDVKRWGALTIGTGLGNARFTNRQNGKG